IGFHRKSSRLSRLYGGLASGSKIVFDFSEFSFAAGLKSGQFDRKRNFVVLYRLVWNDLDSYEFS
ncbi:MAG: hypothetical protein PVJ56_16585, partial [Desulfobacterales bacterium]